MQPRLAVVCALAVALLAACSHNSPSIDPIKSTASLAPVTSTTVADLSGVNLASVSGKTTTTLALGPGKAALNGTVAGPDGPVGGATIHVERLVDDSVAAQDFPSNPDGTFNIPNILGGRYRVRAFVPDPYNLAQADPQIFYLGGSETKKLGLQMGTYSGMAVKSSVAPNPALVESPANLVVQVTTQSVDPKGVVRGQPVVGAKVELFGSSAWLVNTTNPDVTDARGLATFQLTCQSPGDQALSAVINDGEASANITVSGCEFAPPPTTEPPTTVPPATTATTAAGPTSTTKPGTVTTTTSTTRPTVTTTTTTRPTPTTAPPRTTTTKK